MKNKITLTECFQIANDLISGYYEKVVFFKHKNGNQEWNCGGHNDTFPDSDVEFTRANFYDSTKQILGRRMYDSLNSL